MDNSGATIIGNRDIDLAATRSTASVCSWTMKPWMMEHTVRVIDPVVNERSWPELHGLSTNLSPKTLSYDD